VETGPPLKQALAQHGDIRRVLASCEAIAAHTASTTTR
jgi:hypothetical protein